MFAASQVSDYQRPVMPVRCSDCTFSVPTPIEDLAHCLHGRIEIRCSLLPRLCADYVPLSRLADAASATSVSEAASGSAGEAKRLYVPVTRKVSPENWTLDGKVSLTDETKA